MIKLDGAWEPKSYIGPRVEISGIRLTRLFKNTVVLDTEFEFAENGSGGVLTLKDNGLSYAGDASPYAYVKKCVYEGGALTFTDEFVIAGEKTETLYKTENSRYGDITEVSGEVPEGRWRCGDHIIELNGSTLGRGYDDRIISTTEVMTVRYNYDTNGRVYIIDKDPAVSSVGGFGSMYYDGSCIHTFIPVTDITPADMIFVKEQ